MLEVEGGAEVQLEVGILGGADNTVCVRCRGKLRRIVEQSRRQTYVPGREEVNRALRSIAPSIVNSRLWFAVYRVLVDFKAMEKDTLPKFVQMVEEVVPEHAHLPKAKDLQRLDVLSFGKCVKLWDADNAPVTGKWFDMYCKVARQWRLSFENLS